MKTAHGRLGKVLIVALALATGCTSVTDVKLEDVKDKEEGRMAGQPGLRVHGYALKGGEEQAVNAYVRRLGNGSYHFQPVGPQAAVPAFTASQDRVEALLLVRPDVAKSLLVAPLVIVVLPIFLIGAMGSGGDFVEGLTAVSTGGFGTIK